MKTEVAVFIVIGLVLFFVGYPLLGLIVIIAGLLVAG